MNRLLSPQDYGLLKDFSAKLVKLNGGYRDAARVSGRVASTMIHSYCNPDKPRSFMPVDVVLDLQAQIGRPLLSREITRLTDEHSTAKTMLETEIIVGGAKVTALNGEFQALAVSALEDGEVDDKELHDLVAVARRKKVEAADLYDRLRNLAATRTGEVS